MKLTSIELEPEGDSAQLLFSPEASGGLFTLTYRGHEYVGQILAICGVSLEHAAMLRDGDPAGFGPYVRREVGWFVLKHNNTAALLMLEDDGLLPVVNFSAVFFRELQPIGQAQGSEVTELSIASYLCVPELG